MVHLKYITLRWASFTATIHGTVYRRICLFLDKPQIARYHHKLLKYLSPFFTPLKVEIMKKLLGKKLEGLYVSWAFVWGIVSTHTHIRQCCFCDTHFVKVWFCFSGVGNQLVVEPRPRHSFFQIIVKEQCI